MNSKVHSYCDGFRLAQNGPGDWTLRVIKEGGLDSMKIIRYTGPTAEGEAREMLNLLNATLRLQGCDV